jgi:hypothetical protein
MASLSSGSELSSSSSVDDHSAAVLIDVIQGEVLPAPPREFVSSAVQPLTLAVQGPAGSTERGAGCVPPTCCSRWRRPGRHSRSRSCPPWYLQARFRGGTCNQRISVWTQLDHVQVVKNSLLRYTAFSA